MRVRTSKCCSYSPGIQYSLEQEMVQNRASEIQNTVPIILEFWIYVRISKYSTAILENMIYPNRTSVTTARANFEILFGYHGNLDVLESEINAHRICNALMGENCSFSAFCLARLWRALISSIYIYLLI